MNLFDTVSNESDNILPHDGEVFFKRQLLSTKMANSYYKTLHNSIAWKNDEVFMFGKRIVTKREVAWYGDKEFEYTYSKIKKKALLWTKELLEIKSLVENETKETYNSCLLNLYHDETEGMGWHSDDEKQLKYEAAIASLSFGSDRFFSFKHKITKEKVSVLLNHGSLLLMKGSTQTNWLHQLPKTKFKKQPRINLTFRTILE
jgi:alkylated DNA repair dioxygenase AlkB